jgi:amidase
MPIPTPSKAEVARIAAELGFHFDEADVAEFRDLMVGGLAAYSALDALPDELPVPAYPRTPGDTPVAGDNPLNGWSRRVRIEGSPTGPLKGTTFAVKDCICLAGVPLMNGSSTLEGYTPEVDATVVTRLLDAGATLTGKAANEDFCFSGGSHTNARAPVHNPFKRGYGAGGSSSGSAALVGGGEVDFSLGTDQGGSVRQPAAACGLVGIKATWGLVPYTGVLGMEFSLDHVGPLTKTVAENARVLEVIAGPDGFDNRQVDVRTDSYSADLDKGAKGLRIAVVKEGFARPESNPHSDAKVKAALDRLKAAGAVVEEVSIPMHLLGGAIWLPRAAEGCLATMFHGNGFAYGPKGIYLPSAMQRQAMWRHQADLLADTVKSGMLLGEYMRQAYGSRYYARSHNLARTLARAYDQSLAQYDVLAMPTMPFPPKPFPDPAGGRGPNVAAAFENTPNTSPFNATGHPSISLPCGTVDGLPIGLMLTGRFWEERLIYRAAAAVEEVLGDWRKA